MRRRTPPRSDRAVWSWFGGRRAVALPRPNVVMPFDVDPNPTPRVVSRRVRRRVAEQVLVRQLVEEIGERSTQLVDAVGEERAAAGRIRQTDHDLLERLHRDAPALA